MTESYQPSRRIFFMMFAVAFVMHLPLVLRILTGGISPLFQLQPWQTTTDHLLSQNFVSLKDLLDTIEVTHNQREVTVFGRILILIFPFWLWWSATLAEVVPALSQLVMGLNALLTITLLSLGPWLIYFAARILGGSKGATVAGFAFALIPIHSETDPFMLEMQLFGLLISCTVLFAARIYQHSQINDYRLAGFFWGLTLAIHPVALVAIPSLLFLHLARNRHYRFEKRWLHPLWELTLIAVVTFILITPESVMIPEEYGGEFTRWFKEVVFDHPLPMTISYFTAFLLRWILLQGAALGLISLLSILTAVLNLRPVTLVLLSPVLIIGGIHFNQVPKSTFLAVLPFVALLIGQWIDLMFFVAPNRAQKIILPFVVLVLIITIPRNLLILFEQSYESSQSQIKNYLTQHPDKSLAIYLPRENPYFQFLEFHDGKFSLAQKNHASQPDILLVHEPTRWVRSDKPLDEEKRLALKTSPIPSTFDLIHHPKNWNFEKKLTAGIGSQQDLLRDIQNYRYLNTGLPWRILFKMLIPWQRTYPVSNPDSFHLLEKLS